MKKTMFLMMALCAAAFMSCSPSAQTPSGTVKSYFDCMKAGEFKQSLDYLALGKEAGQEELQALTLKMEQALKEQGGLTSYELVEGGETIAEDGNSASVQVVLNMGNEKVQENNIRLKKEGDEWKIDLGAK